MRLFSGSRAICSLTCSIISAAGRRILFFRVGEHVGVGSERIHRRGVVVTPRRETQAFVQVGKPCRLACRRRPPVVVCASVGASMPVLFRGRRVRDLTRSPSGQSNDRTRASNVRDERRDEPTSSGHPGLHAGRNSTRRTGHRLRDTRRGSRARGVAGGGTRDDDRL
jgi:hypothetical protein